MIFGYEDEGAPGPRTKMQIVRVPDDTDGNHQSSPCRRHSVTEIALFNLLIYTFWGRNRAAYELSRKFKREYNFKYIILLFSKAFVLKKLIDLSFNNVLIDNSFVTRSVDAKHDL